jgi:hypothetical protein
MGLEAIITSGIATAKTITSDLQPNVTHAAWTANTSQGKPTYATGVLLPALEEGDERMIRLPTGEEASSHTKLTILQPVTANGATGRREPIDGRDKFTLSNGTVARVLQVKSLTAKSTTAPFMLEVWCG